MISRRAVAGGTLFLGAALAVSACKAIADSPSDIANLPLIEAPARHGNRLAVIITGAGGWASIDRDIAKMLVEGDIAVVGLDSPRYFWKKRTPDALPTAPEIARLAPMSVLCVHGLDEKGTPCPRLRGRHITVRALPGGHHFDGDYRAVAALILEGMDRSP